MWHNEVMNGGEARHLEAGWRTSLQAESQPRIRQIKEEYDRNTGELLEKLFKNYPDGEVLDLGARSEDSQLYIPREYWSRTTSVDWTIDRETEQSLRRDLNEEKLLVKKKFDIVISKEVYGCLKNPDLFLDEAVEALKPGGLIILIDLVGLRGDWVGTDLRRFSVFDPKKIEQEMRKRKIGDIQTTTIDKGLGIGRPGGLCDLVAVIGRK